MNNHSEKKALTKEILHRLYELESILSVTIVGSYVDQKSLSSFSDIDTIVICKKLSKIVPIQFNLNPALRAIDSEKLDDFNFFVLK